MKSIRPTPEEAVSQIPWIGSLSEASLAVLRRLLRLGSVRRNRSVFYQYDTAHVAHLVVSGTVRLTKWRTDDTQIVLSDARTGDWIGAAECLARGSYLCSAEAREEVVVASAGANELDLLMDERELRNELFSQIARAMEVAHELIEHRDPSRMIVAALRRRLAADGRVISDADQRETLAITQDELASIAGLSRETVNRHLAELADAGAVVVERGRITITEIGQKYNE